MSHLPSHAMATIVNLSLSSYMFIQPPNLLWIEHSWQALQTHPSYHLCWNLFVIIALDSSTSPPLPIKLYNFISDITQIIPEAMGSTSRFNLFKPNLLQNSQAHTAITSFWLKEVFLKCKYNQISRLLLNLQWFLIAFRKKKKVPNPYQACKAVHVLALISFLFLFTSTGALCSCHNKPHTAP